MKKYVDKYKDFRKRINEWIEEEYLKESHHPDARIYDNGGRQERGLNYGGGWPTGHYGSSYSSGTYNNTVRKHPYSDRWVKDMGFEISDRSDRQHILKMIRFHDVEIHRIGNGWTKSIDNYIDKWRTIKHLKADIEIIRNGFEKIHGLENLVHVDGFLRIERNEYLETIEGLRNLMGVGRYVMIGKNPYLIELSLPIDINIKAEDSNGSMIQIDFPNIIGDGPKFKTQEAFTNYTEVIELFKNKYNPSIHSDWDVTQILRRVLEYGTDKTVTEVIEHLNSKSGRLVEKLLPEIETKYQERYNTLYKK